LNGLNNIFNTKKDVMLSDKTVLECMKGKDLTGLSRDNDNNRVKNRTTNTNQDAVYENLMDSYQQVLASKSLELMREKYDEAEKNLAPQIDSLNNEISQRLANIEGVKAEEVHKRNRFNCYKKAVDLNIRNNTTGSEMPEVKITKDETGISIKFEKVEIEYNFAGVDYIVKKGEACGNKGFCFKGQRLFFDGGSGRNKNRRALYWATAAYDEATSVCTVTTIKHECTNFDTPYCWNWDTTGVEDNVDREQMPVYNRERDLLTEEKDKK
jgi:hypothetical protein